MHLADTPPSEKDPVETIICRFDDGRQATSTLWIVSLDGKKGIYSILMGHFVLPPDFEEIILDSCNQRCSVRKGDDWGTFCLKQMDFTSSNLSNSANPHDFGSSIFDLLACGPITAFSI